MLILPVDKNTFPMIMTISIEGNTYEFEFGYNVTFDFFSVTLSREGETIISGEKIVLGKPLFTTRQIPFNNTYFIPMDLSGLIPRITFDNFGKDIFLYVFNYDKGVVTSGS